MRRGRKGLIILVTSWGVRKREGREEIICVGGRRVSLSRNFVYVYIYNSTKEGGCPGLNT